MRRKIEIELQSRVYLVFILINRVFRNVCSFISTVFHSSFTWMYSYLFPVSVQCTEPDSLQWNESTSGEHVHQKLLCDERVDHFSFKSKQNIQMILYQYQLLFLFSMITWFPSFQTINTILGLIPFFCNTSVGQLHTLSIASSSNLSIAVCSVYILCNKDINVNHLIVPIVIAAFEIIAFQAMATSFRSLTPWITLTTWARQHSHMWNVLSQLLSIPSVEDSVSSRANVSQRKLEFFGDGFDLGES